MFIVFNKEKIYSYIITLSTITILLGISTVISNNSFETILTSSSNRLIPIYNVEFI